MYLTSIHIEGFKSFAKPTHIEFPLGITAIIGPNGSGKSNVTEAIRWVLGEQSIKQLRGKESTDVIFHGSGGLGQARRARVTLTFNNESHRFPIEAPTVAITRQLTRSGESTYAINGEEVRLADITALLAESGTGAKTFSVISQGMVDRYVTSTPQERKVLFDEATGIKPMQIKLLEAHRKLRKTREHAQEIETVIQEIKPRLALLARQVKKYEKREVLQQEYTAKQADLFCDSWNVEMGHLQGLRVEIEGLEEQKKRAKVARQQAEALLLTQAHQSPLAQLTSQLVFAKSTYASEKAAYTRALEEEKRLIELLTDAQQKHTQAQAHLDKVRRDSDSSNWVTRVVSALRQCQNVLTSFIQGDNTVDTNYLQDLLQAVTTTTKQLEHMSAEDMIKMATDELAQPIQAVAHFAALREERQRQLETLQRPQAPSQKNVKRLEEDIAALQAQEKTSQESMEVGSLEAARDSELEVERNLSSALAALETSQHELAEIEEEILRERGSEFLSSIQKGLYTLNTATPPSETEVHKLAATLAAIGEPDPLVQKEYEEAKQRYDHLTKQLMDITQAATNIVDLMGKLHTRMQQTFAVQFAIIERAFRGAFQELFDGGEAHITRTEEGIDISAAPPGKRRRHVTLLSGGERSLTSLALLTAIIEAQRPPFIVLDEVDAALDEANSQRFAALLRKQCKETQCIVVSHNREVMASADVLYGVTMQQEGVSNVYSVQMADIFSQNEKPTKQHELQV